ncbi:MAG: hypothetical protein ACR2OC_02775 [Solirubrobacterales bacterium]
MDRDLLSGFLEDGLSLNEIAKNVSRHPSTVGYWIAKHGLVANGHEKYAGRGGISKVELERLVSQGLTLREIAVVTDRSISNVRYWIRRHELQRPIDVRRNELEEALKSGQRILMRQCGQHGWTQFVIENSGRVRCRKCRQERVSEWRRRTKARLVEEAGGACVLCGYDRCQAALEFHHLDPSEKAFGLSMRGITRSIEELRKEAAKCVLLCANCHAEVEAGFSSIQASRITLPGGLEPP